VNNVTPPGAPGAAARPVTTPTPRSRQNQIIALAVFVIVLVLLVRACSGHENRYERIARDFTAAVQNNDYAGVTKLENSETAAETTRGRLGRGADALSPLGKIRSVREDTPKGDAARVHEFNVTFDRGTVREKFKFDPQDKIVSFAYDAPQTTTK
jgi:hypothetical protein